jgi:hypothetical protein
MNQESKLQPLRSSLSLDVGRVIGEFQARFERNHRQASCGSNICEIPRNSSVCIASPADANDCNGFGMLARVAYTMDAEGAYDLANRVRIGCQLAAPHVVQAKFFSRSLVATYIGRVN